MARRRAGNGRKRGTTRGRGAPPVPADPLEERRRLIDALDRRIVRLLNERANQAIALGKVKKDRGLPIYQPEREDEVLRNVQDCNGGPLESAALRRLFERILDESRRSERLGASAEEPDGAGTDGERSTAPGPRRGSDGTPG